MDDSAQARCALQQLLAYWQARPQAADTVEGIQRWWLRSGWHWIGSPGRGRCRSVK